MNVQILDQPFDPLDALRIHQEGLRDLHGSFGATAVFIGTMRDLNEGDSVQRMELEHYPAMTQRHLEKISAEAREKWEILDTLIVHRVGVLQPNDPIVLVAAWSAHRAEAFAACRYLIEELKSRAPFWKKETLEEGERWVEHNTPG
ncbi:MAG: molybdopterin synthase catalytic subunit MoaE [Gammaproteobacteria bacterium]